VAGQLQQLATHVRDCLAGAGVQRLGMSELEQRSESINTLVKQHERQMKQEMQRTRYSGSPL